MKTKLIIASIAAMAAIIVGCTTTPPAALESYLFDIKTNLTPTVLTVTNAAGVTFQEERLIPVVTQTPSAALNSWAALASGVANAVSPGSGSLVGIGLLGASGFFALNRQRKLTAAVQGAEQTEKEFFTAQTLAENFAQSIEVIREVLKTTPQGQSLDVRIVDMLHKNQVSIGLIREAVAIVENTVSNSAAKDAARKILSLIPPAPQTTPS